MQILTNYTWLIPCWKPLMSTWSPTKPQAKPAEPCTCGGDKISLSTKELKDVVREHFGHTEQTPSWDSKADLNEDGVVNVKDKVIVREMQRKELVSQHFGQTSQSDGYDPKADLNKDGVVNVLDKVIARNSLLKLQSS